MPENTFATVNPVGRILFGDLGVSVPQTVIHRPMALLEDLVEVTRFCAQKGWTPATSSNFSVRDSDDQSRLWVTLSGKDKGRLTPDDFMAANFEAQPVLPNSGQPSAETLLHGVIYHNVPWAHCVLHTHSVAATLVSQANEAEQRVSFSQLEILKGLRGIHTHQTEVAIPIFSNDQDMARLSTQVNARFEETRMGHSFLLAGHGVYTWGSSPQEARRHLEVLEFLFQCQLSGMHHGHTHYSG